MSDQQSGPVLRVISGSPTPEEIATIIAVVCARGPVRTQPAPSFSLWAHRSRQTRPALRPGYGAWRASAMPR